jgi:hypothetical protein
MNRYYFADKGITRKLNCPNIWPVSHKEFNRVPRHVFDTPGLVVYIEPKLVQGIPMGKFAIFDPAKVRYRRHYYLQDVEMMEGGACVMHADYFNSGQTVIHTVIQGGSLQTDPASDWRVREICIPTLREAIDLFLRYFPKIQL